MPHFFRLLLVLALTMLTGCRSATAAAPPKRYNVLFIAIDDLKPDLGCYGHKEVITPNIDRLASQGVLFERAYCQQAVCAPSRDSLLTGCRPDTTKIYGLETPLRQAMPNVVTLPQLFRQAGYQTISLGKIYHHREDDFPQGWSEEPWWPDNIFPGNILPENRELNRINAENKKAGRPPGSRGDVTESPDVADEAYPDGQIAQRAIEKLRANKDRPFFLAVGFGKPHLPFTAPKKYWDWYDPAKIKLPDNPDKPKDAPDASMTSYAELRQYRGVPKKGPIPQELARRLIHGYRACTSFTDVQVGKVIAELDKLGLGENTIIVLWGDHGWHLGDHGLWCKHTNFEQAVRVPLIWRVPGIKNARASGMVELVDVYPTLAELCNLEPALGLEGASMKPLLKSPQRTWKSAVFSQYPRTGGMGHSVTDGRFRYTRWHWDDPKRSDEIELYDHQRDPKENVNVAANPEYAAEKERMAKLLEAGWRDASSAIPSN
jgi:iduronate 2-sulfatase